MLNSTRPDSINDGSIQDEIENLADFKGGDGAVQRSGNQRALEKRLFGLVAKASADYSMIQAGDRVMVCMSGGADSYTMLNALRHCKRIAPFDFSIIAVNLDQKQPNFPKNVLPRYLEKLGVEYKIVERDTYTIVKEKIPEGKTTCSLCSRLRRGILYSTADDVGATKIALGHHRDDILETFLLNLFNGGALKTMPPKLLSDDGRHTVVRPLAYCKERDIKAYARAQQFPIIPCDLCGSQPNLQRQAMKRLLETWDREHPSRLQSMFTALGHVVPSHLLDHDLFSFTAMSQNSAAPCKTENASIKCGSNEEIAKPINFFFGAG